MSYEERIGNHLDAILRGAYEVGDNDGRAGIANQRQIAREADAELASLRERLAAAERERDRLLGADPNKPPVADGLMRWKPILKGNILGMMGDADGGYVEFHEYRRLWNRLTRAEADGAAIRATAQHLVDEASDSGNGYPELDMEPLLGLQAALASDHPGADLLARATAAEAVVEAARNLRKVDQDIRVGSAGMMNAREAALALDAALAEVAALERYQAAIASGLSHAEAQEEGWPATYDARVQEGM